MDAVSLRDRLRRLFGAMAVEGGFQLLSRAGRFLPEARKDRPHVEVIHDVPYRRTGRWEHTLDVYLPKRGKGPFPVVMYVHGGGFKILSKNTHWIMGQIFARRGFVCFNINYRLAPSHPFPAALEDAAHALAWVREHAQTYLGDVRRLVLAGESAGANIVTALTVASSYVRREPWAQKVWNLDAHPSVVVPMCGMLQVSDPHRFTEIVPDLTPFVFDSITDVTRGYLHDSDEDRDDLADPLLVLEQLEHPDRELPAFYASVGTADPLLSDTQRLEHVLKKLDVPHLVRYATDELHAYQAFVWRAASRAHWRSLFEFLRELL